MLSNIRKKVTNVLQEGLTIPDDLINSFRPNASSSNSNSSSSHNSSLVFIGAKAEIGIPSDINLKAGSKLIEKNENIWRDIHEANETNSEKAIEVDRSITRIKEKVEKSYTDLGNLNRTLITMPNIMTSIQECNKLLSLIRDEMNVIEVKLVQFEDLNEELALQERQLEKKLELSAYKQKKIAQLENVRKELASKYEKKVHDFEESLKNIQQERQAAFQEAFQRDLEIYKSRGSIPKIELPTTSEVALEEITLTDETNNTELENFLNT